MIPKTNQWLFATLRRMLIFGTMSGKRVLSRQTPIMSNGEHHVSFFMDYQKIGIRNLRNGKSLIFPKDASGSTADVKNPICKFRHGDPDQDYPERQRTNSDSNPSIQR